MVNEILINLNKDQDIIKARELGRELAKQAGFSEMEQMRTVTAISELAHSMHEYTVEAVFSVKMMKEKGKRGLKIKIKEQGTVDSEPKLDSTSLVNSENNGIFNVKQLVDEFIIQVDHDRRTSIEFIKWG
ncbi:hypothetical protein [Ammoniphilus sp. CFH 90114]|uniref:hypothetical protein n=1 Tax=Ammoniphilus sp. CFH 90114 TaxID=2493665 RepID=UPI00100E7FE1|nr:hypothetical protein [Ammoniphilus sp. CFH 90114]RXT15457.1 hypothetical protein EIZ39_04485 [Ammoniphilus sp. CFH 90114]